MVKIAIAPDSFKGSYSALEVTHFIEEGIKNYNNKIETVKLPLSDGGDGFLDIFSYHLDCKEVIAKVSDPLGREVFGKLLQNGDTAYIEMAQASGLSLLSEEERDPELCSSFGFGELIKKAMDLGSKSIILGLGGSATNDGGAGMAEALGVKFYSQSKIINNIKGRDLLSITKIDISELDPRVRDCSYTIGSDVKNPLLGSDGSTFIYGKQKGGSIEKLQRLEKGMVNYHYQLSDLFGRSFNSEGMGAAGGCGAGVSAFLNGKIGSGINLILERVGFEDRVRGCDLIITGEGCCDYQSSQGKVVSGVADLGRRLSIPVIVIAGSLDEGYDSLFAKGIRSIYSISNNLLSVKQTISRTRELIIELVTKKIGVSDVKRS
jgi:glycerate kinase